MSYWSNTVSVFCVSQTFLGQSVSSQTVADLLRNPLLTSTATSRCVGSVHSRSHLLSNLFCSVKFCLKYTYCDDIFFTVSTVKPPQPYCKLCNCWRNLNCPGVEWVDCHYYITLQISCCICIGCVLTLLIWDFNPKFSNFNLVVLYRNMQNIKSLIIVHSVTYRL